MTETVRLAELIGGLTLAADLVSGFPPEKVLRTAILASRLAQLAGLDASVQRDAYYLTLFRFLGCTGFAHEEAHEFGAGDDITTRNVMALADAADPLATLGAIASKVAVGSPPLERLGVMTRLASPEAPRRHAHAQCETSLQMATLVGMSEGVLQALPHLCERHDGRGFPAGLAGEALAIASRSLHVADVAEIVHHRFGTSAALEVVRRRAGHHLDPALARVFGEGGADLLDRLARGSCWQLFLAAEPEPVMLAHPDQRERVALAFARFVDLKSVYTLDHSSRVAELAVRAGELAGLPDPVRAELRVAALLHDLGRVHVPNRIWDKPGPLDELEWERVRLHAYYTERILARSPAWAGAARIAIAAHEREDGAGYHRGLRSNAMELAERLLAAADMAAALVATRPHRPALERGRALDVLGRAVRDGQLSRVAVDAVSAALNGATEPARRTWPRGLSDREVEVLRLVALGKSNMEVGQLLGISPKTVKNHVANLYAKIGVYSRAGAALFAIEHELLRADG